MLPNLTFAWPRNCSQHRSSTEEGEVGRAKAKELREARIGWSERYWVRWVLVNGCVCVCVCVCFMAFERVFRVPV